MPLYMRYSRMITVHCSTHIPPLRMAVQTIVPCIAVQPYLILHGSTSTLLLGTAVQMLSWYESMGFVWSRKSLLCIAICKCALPLCITVQMCPLVRFALARLMPAPKARAQTSSQAASQSGTVALQALYLPYPALLHHAAAQSLLHDVG